MPAWRRVLCIVIGTVMIGAGAWLGHSAMAGAYFSFMLVFVVVALCGLGLVLMFDGLWPHLTRQL